LIFSTIILLFFCAFSCNEEELTTNELLQGTWTVDSFNAMRMELINTEFSSVTLAFVSSNETEGAFTASLTDNIEGANPNASASTYEIVEEGSRLRIGDDTLDMSISATSLSLSGNLFFQPGGTVEIVASK